MLKYRQGDVGIEVATEIPSGLEFKAAKNAVLAEGEVTGHFHVITCPEIPREAVSGGKSDGTEYPLEVAMHDGTMYLRISEPLPLKHAEHATITIEPGTYKVQRQQEYFPDAPRTVAD